MQLLKTKLLQSVLLALLLMVGASSAALASSPHVIVTVKDQSGLPIPGVNVKWLDKNGNTLYMPTTAASYEIRDEQGGKVTINSGEALFQSWDLPPEKGGFPLANTQGPLFDHDFDAGTDQIPQWNVTELGGREGRFGCGQNPHEFSVLAPKDMNLVCSTANGGLVELKNQELTNTFHITCQKVTPKCPATIRNVSCNPPDSSMTVGWDEPEGGADGYQVYYDRYPFDDQGEGDTLLSDVSKNLQRTWYVTYNTPYRIRVKTIKKVNDQEFKSEACWTDLICNNKTCEGDECKPTGTLTGQMCPAKPNQYYYNYTLSNIDTKDQPFKMSRFMITFSLNGQTRQILNFLTNNGQTQPSFSLWNEQGRTPQDGDYFGFYVQEFTVLPSNNTLTMTLNDATPVGQKTVGELRQFLDANNLPTQHNFKANMTTKIGTQGEIFNSHIPASGKINLSFAAANAICSGACVAENGTPPACVQDIVITSPGSIPVVPNAQNQITVTWTSSSPAGSVYEAVLFDKDVYPSPLAALNAHFGGTAAPKTVLYFSTTTKSQVFDLDNMKGTNLAVSVRGETASSCSPEDTSLNCNWSAERSVPPPGFTVTGKFYDSETCQEVNPISLTGRTVSVAGMSDISAPINGNSYTLNVPYTDTAHTIQLNLGASPADPYVCSPCNPTGKQCNRYDVTETTNTNVDFFVHEELVFTESWWNVYGGQIYSKGDIRSQLPNPAGQDLFRFIKRALGAEGNPLTAGLPITHTGQFLINGGLSERADGNQLQVKNVNLNDLPIKPDYAYYSEKLAVPFQSGILGTINTLSDMGSGASLDDNVVVYHKEGSLTFNPNQTWNIPSGQHRIVLVSGDLVFSGGNLASGNQITAVTEGGTLTFVAKEKIIINGNVGNTQQSSTVPNLEGIFIGKEITVLGGEERRFVGSGSFYGWQNVSLTRQYANDDLNTDNPTETFIYRPDFVINLPDILRETNITWKEVN